MSAQSQFAGKVKELISQSKNLSLDARKAVIDLLNEARKQIVGELAGIDPSSYTGAQLNVLKHSIESAMEKFRTGAIDLLDAAEAKEFLMGRRSVTEPLVAAGLETSASFGQVSSSSLKVVQGYTADLISGLSKDASTRINASIQRAFLGGQQITDVIAQVGKALPGAEGFSGIFSAIGKRASGITLNETLRLHSIAAQASLEDSVDRHPDLQKQWQHLNIAMKPRIGHVVADGQVVNVDQPFSVEGEDLMYPRDPSGSAENTISCHCLVVPYFAADALKPSKEQKGLLDSLGISVSAA